MKTKIVSCHTADSKAVKLEVNSTVILPPLVFPALIMNIATKVMFRHCFQRPLYCSYYPEVEKSKQSSSIRCLWCRSMVRYLWFNLGLERFSNSHPNLIFIDVLNGLILLGPYQKISGQNWLKSLISSRVIEEKKRISATSDQNIFWCVQNKTHLFSLCGHTERQLYQLQHQGPSTL